MRLALAASLLALSVAAADATTYFDAGGGEAPNAVVPLVGCPNGGGTCSGPVSSTNPMPVTGSFSATLSGFAPGGAYATPLSVTTSSARVALPTGTVVIVYNTGANAAYVQLGGSGVTATTSDDVIQPNSWLAFTVGSNTNLAAITASSTASLNISGGSGLPTGAGGGSSGGGGTVSQGTANTAANAWPETLVIGGAVNSAANGIFVNPATGATFAVTQSGTWTIQPGNTANTTPWLMTISQGGNSAPVITASAATSSDKALEVTVANTNANGPAASAASSPVVIASDQAAIAIKGGAASGAALSGNPVAAAVRGSTADQTAVTDGQAVVPEATPNGKLVVQPWALTPNLVDGGGSSTGTGTFTVLAASGSASLKEYMTSLQCGRSDAGTTAITVAISDGTKTRTFVIPDNGGGGGNNALLASPIVFAANTAVTAAFSSGVTTGYCNAEGFYAP